MADKDKVKKILKTTAIALGATYVVLDLVAKHQKADSVYANDPEQRNPMEGKKVVFTADDNDPENADGACGHLEAVGTSEAATRNVSFYEKVVKRACDKVLSFGGLVLLSPLMGGIALAIHLEDPGSVIFTQKRVGQDKAYFKLHKFRSMKMSTPHDVPTHMLENPESYITRVGGFIRRHSLDELPQIWDIFLGNMSVIGPRPALWNQDLLTSERDKYGANDVKPGLTGWAQINGRDELEIPDKARLDGKYVEALGKGMVSAATMDAKCFLGSLHVFNGDSSVVEGGTRELEREKAPTSPSMPDEDTTPLKPKHILITGAGSYIGESVKAYLEEANDILGEDFYTVTVCDTMGWAPVPSDFKDIDVVFNVAGIAHIKETDENRHLYYEVNRDLVVKIAKAAKKAGVKQFILLSSMSVYGLTTGHITKLTEPKPNTAYGESKAQADEEIHILENNDFRVAYLRPPMVYGKGCKGNYQTLREFALKSPVFPSYKNARSMIYIGNLCEFVKRVIDSDSSGLFFPQNIEYVNTSEMVRLVALDNGKKIEETGAFNPAVNIAAKTVDLVEKVFGNLTYEKVDMVSKYSFEESIKLTESNSVEKEETDFNTGSSNHLVLEHIIKHNPFVQESYRVIMSGAFSALGKFVKTDEKLVLMNGHGYKYNDSPRAIYRKMHELGLTNKYKVVWALNDPDGVDIPGCTKIKMDTPEYFMTALRAKYWISCVNIERGLQFKKKDQVYLNTWHGAAINVCGNGVKGRNDFHWGYIDYFCACGKLDEECFGKDLEVIPSAFLECGYPRNDELFNVTQERREQILKKLHLDGKRKIILYAPTWRESDDGGASYKLAPPIDWAKWEKELGDQYIVLLRTHPYTTKLMNVEFNDFVLDFTEYPEVNDLMIAADVLISDYSSINLDYSITGKPMICFGYDYDEYKQDRGFYYDLEKEMPNGVMRSEDAVIGHLKNMNYKDDCKKTVNFYNKHMEFCRGDATIRCINTLFHTDFRA